MMATPRTSRRLAQKAEDPDSKGNDRFSDFIVYSPLRKTTLTKENANKNSLLSTTKSKRNETKNTNFTKSSIAQKKNSGETEHGGPQVSKLCTKSINERQGNSLNPKQNETKESIPLELGNPINSTKSKKVNSIKQYKNMDDKCSADDTEIEDTLETLQNLQTMCCGFDADFGEMNFFSFVTATVNANFNYLMGSCFGVQHKIMENKLVLYGSLQDILAAVQHFRKETLKSIEQNSVPRKKTKLSKDSLSTRKRKSSFAIPDSSKKNKMLNDKNKLDCSTVITGNQVITQTNDADTDELIRHEHIDLTDQSIHHQISNMCVASESPLKHTTNSPKESHIESENCKITNSQSVLNQDQEISQKVNVSQQSQTAIETKPCSVLLNRVSESFTSDNVCVSESLTSTNTCVSDSITTLGAYVSESITSPSASLPESTITSSDHVAEAQSNVRALELVPTSSVYESVASISPTQGRIIMSNTALDIHGTPMPVYTDMSEGVSVLVHDITPSETPGRSVDVDSECKDNATELANNLNTQNVQYVQEHTVAHVKMDITNINQQTVTSDCIDNNDTAGVLYTESKQGSGEVQENDQVMEIVFTEDVNDSSPMKVEQSQAGDPEYRIVSADVVEQEVEIDDSMTTVTVATLEKVQDLGVTEQASKQQKTEPKNKPKAEKVEIPGSLTVTSRKSIHKRLVKTDPSKATHSCELCDYKSSQAGIARHMARRHSKSIYNCRVCLKPFGIRYDMRRHQWLHFSNTGRLNPKGVKLLKQKQPNVAPESMTLQQLEQEFENKFSETAEIKPASVETSNVKAEDDDEMLLRCYKCNYESETINEMEVHYRHHHMYKYQCERCPQLLSTYGDVMAHIASCPVRYRKKNKPPGRRSHMCKCELCDHTCRQKYISAHFEEKHKHKVVCAMCGVMLDSIVPDAKQHLIDHHSKMLRTKRNLVEVSQTGMARPSKDKPMSCPVCKIEVTKRLLRYHVLRHGENIQLPCERCDFVTTKFGYYMAHMNNMHPDLDDLKCTQCDFIGGSREVLRRHIFNLHREFDTHTCKDCGKTFMAQSLLKTHIKRLHTNERPFVCSICGQGYVTKHELKIHQHVHSEGQAKEEAKRHVCSYCGRKFLRKSAMKMHENVHTGRKPYQCQICGMRFSYTSNLNSHKRKHQEKGIHQCPMCNKSFKFPVKLRAHMILHTKEGKFRCRDCGKIFTTSTTLRKHICKAASSREQYQIVVDKVRADGALLGVEVEHVEVGNLDGMLAFKGDGNSDNQDVKEEEDEVIYMCGLCQTAFNSKEAISEHVLAHETGDTKTETHDDSPAMVISEVTDSVNQEIGDMIFEQVHNDGQNALTQVVLDQGLVKNEAREIEEHANEIQFVLEDGNVIKGEPGQYQVIEHEGGFQILTTSQNIDNADVKQENTFQVITTSSDGTEMVQHVDEEHVQHADGSLDLHIDDSQVQLTNEVHIPHVDGAHVDGATIVQHIVDGAEVVEHSGTTFIQQIVDGEEDYVPVTGTLVGEQDGVQLVEIQADENITTVHS